MPFVAVFGLDADDQLLFTALAAVDVAICWWMLGRLRVSGAVRLATTIFFAFGTVFWYTAQLATTWYQAHIVAVGLTMLAVGLALRRSGAASRPRRRMTARAPPARGDDRSIDRRPASRPACCSGWRRPPA